MAVCRLAGHFPPAERSLPIETSPDLRPYGTFARGLIVFNRRMLSLEEISDRLELQHLLISYSEAIDRREFDELDAIFTPDAYIDYRDTGGIDGAVPADQGVAGRRAAHLLQPERPHAGASGDQARRRHRHRPDVLLQPDGAQRATSPRPCRSACWYDDEFVRTADGWRISRRVEIKCYDKVL